MGIKVRRGPLPALGFILMILLQTNICRATSRTKNSLSNSSCDVDQDDCLIVDINWEEEFMMESETSRRMMIDYGDAVTPRTSEPKSPALACGQGQAYKDCLPSRNADGIPEEPCDRYKRTCG